MDAAGSATRINIDSVRITGAAPGTDATRLDHRLRAGFSRLVSGTELPAAAPPREIANIRVHLPHTAGEAEIAETVLRAVAAARKDQRP